MTFVIKKVSDYGTKNPIVAGLGMQTHEIVNFFHIEKEKKDTIFRAYMSHVKPRLLKCKEIAEAVGEETEVIRTKILANEITTQSYGRVIELPQVAELVERSETFLYNAKSALRDIVFIFEPIFGERFTHSRYNLIHTWAEERFGNEAPLTELLSDNKPWIRRVVDMRNAVEHPADRVLRIVNFELIGTNEKGQRFFQEPVWYFDGEQPASISKDMHIITDNVLRFAEDLLVVSYLQLHPASIVQFAEIPESDRNPDCPVRLRAVLDKSKLKPGDPMQAPPKIGGPDR